MKTYLKFKKDINGFQDVFETVKTVEKISASSIHNLKQKVKALEMYEASIAEMMKRLSFYNIQSAEKLTLDNKSSKKVLVVVGGNKGLVGGMYHNLINMLMQKKSAYSHIVVIGKKTETMMIEAGFKPDKFFQYESDTVSQQDIETYTKYFFDGFASGLFGSTDILYNRFVSLLEQEPVTVPFLPFKFEENFAAQTEEAGKKPAAIGFPVFEPSKEKTYEWILRKYIGIYFYKIMMEAKLSELSARTVAMEDAGAKTKKFIKKIKLTYLKERKKNETQKQLESFNVHNIV